jgi:5-methylcytosine-specific restriction endonuclease McrA
MPIRPENRARYPKNWKRRSFFVRFVRARGRCEWCGAEHGKPHPETGSTVVLTTAHVHDDRPEASDLLNLAALCQKCHNGHDATDRRRRHRERIDRESGQAVLAIA